MNDKAFYEPVGNNTEVALLKFLQRAEIPVHEQIRQKYGYVEASIPFSTIRKTSAVAMHYPNEDKVKIFVKGAPETLVLNCTSTYDENGECMFLDDEH